MWRRLLYGENFRSPVKKEKKEESEMTQEEFKLLVHKRGQIKAKVTRIRNKLKDAEADQQLASLPQLRVFSKNMDTHYQEFNEVHDLIIGSCTESAMEHQESKYEEFEVLYNDTCLVIESLKDALAPQAPQIGGVIRPGSVQQQQVIVQQQALKVPLPTFDGKYENWPRFKAMFQDLMRRSQDCDAIKLYHLEKSLVEAAVGVIGSQTIQDNNYEQAWKILEDRYENKRLIINTHIRGLLNLKRMTKKSSKELRDLIDECCRHVENLKFLKQELLGISELFVVFVLTSSLDPETREHWESCLTHGELPTYEETIDCLKKKCLVLERCENANPVPVATKSVVGFKVGASPFPKSMQKTSNAVTSTSEVVCELCGGPHPNFKCIEFRNMTVGQRIAKVKEVKLCFNCLRKGHRSNECLSEKTCSKCAQKHNTLLHFDETNITTQDHAGVSSNNLSPQATVNHTSIPAETEPVAGTSALVSHVSSSRSNRPMMKEVLLLTAVVNVLDAHGRPHSCRALLDCASQVCLISQDLANKLGKPSWSTNTEVVGVTGRKTTNQGIIATVVSNYCEFQLDVPCLIMPQVSGLIPTRKIDMKNWKFPPNVKLADPEFYSPSRVDLLIGNEFFFSLLQSGQMKINDDMPLLQETSLGWVIAGPVDVPEQHIVFSHVVTKEALSDSIQRFWEVEEVSEASPFTSEEQQIETHFVETHSRDESGRFTVRLPFRELNEDLGNNRALALKRFLLLERRFQRDPDFRKQYCEFIAEYEALGHLREIEESTDPPGLQCYYLPHHAVLKPSSSSTKLRVVFDATARASGPALNDVLLVGPTIQSEMYEIVLRFRRPQIAFTGDVTKMYRQLLVDRRDTPFQRIFFRINPDDPLRVLELVTVTYGTASAPFLATRALVQLAEDENSEFPNAAAVVRQDFYIDDVLTGADTEEEAIGLRRELQMLLARGGFDIKKWCSNSEAVLADIPENDREKLVKIDDSEDTVKTLGLLWDPKNDQFRYSVNSFDKAAVVPITKRYVLSQISRLFDPLGLVSPVVVLAKVLMQQIWARKLEWDDILPEDLLSQWMILRDSFIDLLQVKIPRCVFPPRLVRIEVHGFGDASNYAYGACIYVRALKDDGLVECHLLTSKSKVAPLTDMSIPRKELCAALLLVRLTMKVISTMKMSSSSVILWSDSQIVLAWLRKSPCQLQTFVRNRVAEINRLTFDCAWEYVKSADNPADIVSRGQHPKGLSDNKVWWCGPEYLLQPKYEVEIPKDIPEDAIPELRSEAIVNLATIELLPVFNAFSDFRKLQRVLAMVLRFIRNTQTKVEANRQRSKYITIPEMRQSLETIVKVIQYSELPDEIRSVENGEPSKRFAMLHPSLQNGILRVGGRLQNSNLPFDAKHQMILPNCHPVTDSIIKKLHEDYLHVGPAGLLALLRQKFWISNARSTIRKVIRSCIPCFRTKPRKIQQLMGNLPDFRVTPAMPFEFVGVDFAGPVMVKEGRFRPKIVKGYVAVYVCLATKNVHLELVSSLTKEAFLASLDRFVNRRGLTRMILSDNATNFSGASNELRELYLQFKTEAMQAKIHEFLLPREIEWRFIPPRAPNFAGLMEAAVKSVKTHIKRTLQNATLTFEEFATMLTHIESILNSRPLYAISEDPNEPLPITPAHLQIGRALQPVPKPSLVDIKENRLSRWQYLNQLRDHFWKRWSREYLSTLQARGKWTKETANIVPGMLVLVIEDNLPPQSWKYGKIVKTYPGQDSLVRVADVQTAQGVFKRAISKLAPLPTKDNEELQIEENLLASTLHASARGENVWSP